MKRNRIFFLLAAEAVLCMVFVFLRSLLPEVFSSLLAFPFAQIGLLLRHLSLSGAVGNAVAIALYVLFSLIPAFSLLPLRKMRPLQTEDSLLGLTAVLLFPVLWYAVNPGCLPGAYAGSAAAGLASSGCLVYSVLCAWAVLRLLRHLGTSDRGRLQRILIFFFHILNVYLVWCAFGLCLRDIIDNIAAVRAANQGNEHLLGTTYIFLAVQGLLNALPYLLDILVVLAAQKLLRELEQDRYSDGAVAAAQQLQFLCRRALVITVLTICGFNLLQFLFAGSLHAMHSTLYLPLFSIGLCLAVLLLARLIPENKQLKDDNDLFI